MGSPTDKVFKVSKSLAGLAAKYFTAAADDGSLFELDAPRPRRNCCRSMS